MTNINEFENMSNSQIFLSNKNRFYMLKYIKSFNENINIIMDNSYGELSSIMYSWAKKNNIDKISNINNSDNNDNSDKIQEVFYLNMQFLNDNLYLKQGNNQDAINVFRLSAVVLDEDNVRQTKKYTDMLASDYHTLNLHNNSLDKNVYVTNNISRYGNKIPTWQKSMNVRHYESEGGINSKYTSPLLESQSRGYDMSNIIKGSKFC